MSELQNPFGLSISSDDILYICDTENHRIVTVDLKSNKTDSIFGSTPKSSMNGFHKPHDVFNVNTSLYVLDTRNYRVQKLSLNGSNPTTILNYSRSYSCYYIYVDHEANIYLSASLQHKVVLYRSNSTNETMIAGDGTLGSKNNQLNRPYGMFVDRKGTLYIADRYNHRIMKWTRGARLGIGVAGNGTKGAQKEQLSFPVYVTVDRNEYMYISEDGNHRIIRWAPNSKSGKCIVGCAGNSGNAPNQLCSPHSLAFDSDGSLYVSDWCNNRIQKFQILSTRSEYFICL